MRLVPERFKETAIWRRWQKLASEFAKFGTIGVINTAINYGIFNALLLTGLTQGKLKANIAATIVATTASYFLNRHWTYRDRPKSTLRREYVLFFVFNLAGLVIELGVLALAVYGFAITGLIASNVAKTVGLVLGTLFRFWAYRTFVFPAGLADSAVPTQVPPKSAPDSATGTPLTSEFDQLTRPLEAEFADDLNRNDLDADRLNAEGMGAPVTAEVNAGAFKSGAARRRL